MPKNNSYPRFVHDRIETHDIMGEVKIYAFSRYPRVNDSGCQTNFFRNNAKINNERQFGLKMFNTSIEAYAAYQRQKMAAKIGLAPPVGRMVRWIIGGKRTKKVNRWGYETALADCSKNAAHRAYILSSATIRKAYTRFWNDRPDLGSSLDEQGRMDHFFDIWKQEYCSCIPEEFYGISEFDPEDPFYYLRDEKNLRTRLAAIDLTGVQYDDISEFDGGSVPWSSRHRLGTTYEVSDRARMGNDLHSGNVALWKGKAVCIDFGYHCCSSYYYSSAVEMAA